MQPLSNVQIMQNRHLFTNWQKHIPFAAVAFIPLLSGKWTRKSYFNRPHSIKQHLQIPEKKYTFTLETLHEKHKSRLQ